MSEAEVDFAGQAGGEWYELTELWQWSNGGIGRSAS